MTKGVTQGPELCQMSVSFPDKKMAKNESNRCVCGTISVCVCLVDCFTQWSDIRCDSSELFTVPGLSENEETEWEDGGGGGVGITSEAYDGVRSLSVSREGVRACMFWHSEVSAHSPIITW